MTTITTTTMLMTRIAFSLLLLVAAAIAPIIFSVPHQRGFPALQLRTEQSIAYGTKPCPSTELYYCCCTNTRDRYWRWWLWWWHTYRYTLRYGGFPRINSRPVIIRSMMYRYCCCHCLLSHFDPSCYYYRLLHDTSASIVLLFLFLVFQHHDRSCRRCYCSL